MTEPPAEPRVVTVDDRGQVLGTAPRLQAHQSGGIRHLAISVVVVHSDGRVLLQQRADTKPLFAGRWSNAVCTHPLPGEEPVAAAARRLHEELALRCDLSAAGTFVYEALDAASGLSENELDHVFVARCDADPVPDPTEVAAVRWIHADDLADEMADRPEVFTPWLKPVLVTAGLEQGSSSIGHPPTGASATVPTEEPT